MAATAGAFIPPEPKGPVRIDLMSRLGLGRPGPARQKPGVVSTETPSKRAPKHRAGDK